MTSRAANAWQEHVVGWKRNAINPRFFTFEEPILEESEVSKIGLEEYIQKISDDGNETNNTIDHHINHHVDEDHSGNSKEPA